MRACGWRHVRDVARASACASAEARARTRPTPRATVVSSTRVRVRARACASSRALTWLMTRLRRRLVITLLLAVALGGLLLGVRFEREAIALSALPPPTVSDALRWWLESASAQTAAASLSDALAASAAAYNARFCVLYDWWRVESRFNSTVTLVVHATPEYLDALEEHVRARARAACGRRSLQRELRQRRGAAPSPSPSTRRVDACATSPPPCADSTRLGAPAKCHCTSSSTDTPLPIARCLPCSTSRQTARRR